VKELVLGFFWKGNHFMEKLYVLPTNVHELKKNRALRCFYLSVSVGGLSTTFQSISSKSNEI